MRKVTVKDAARMLGVTEQCIRIGLQREKFDFGVAFKSRDKNRVHNYVIYPELLKNTVGEKRFMEVMGQWLTN